MSRDDTRLGSSGFQARCVQLRVCLGINSLPFSEFTSLPLPKLQKHHHIANWIICYWHVVKLRVSCCVWVQNTEKKHQNYFAITRNNTCMWQLTLWWRLCHWRGRLRRMCRTTDTTRRTANTVPRINYHHWTHNHQLTSKATIGLCDKCQHWTETEISRMTLQAKHIILYNDQIRPETVIKGW